jgi:hypothetical protein
MSKGSKQRPTNREKYNDNYERIFGNKGNDKESRELDTASAGRVKNKGLQK